ncbi:glycine zipper 2TM domain-containing protein [Massilia sp. TS11]|uniref:glycine zipper 2TM domain-containing protein n=1 Tax=Massilia sp. TS11 TaxID=2908003 RepID=UPI001EDB68FF|nr:glycine zipper 2TM domain-containing protein [Massilia sp. TS11]MCG2582751.1 glycine zipper 2TM domain-containing protein [Massilia sp. TS11]
MKLQAKLIIAALGLGALPLVQASDFEDFGRVVKVRPLVEQVNRPRQECRTEYVQVPVQQQAQPQGRSAGGAILGGIAGAIIGNQVGGGNGRTAATAAGAIAGAMVGDRVDNDGRQAPPPPAQMQEQAVRQCRTVDNWEQRTTGYEVTYDYRGRSYTSVMSHDPGQRVRLRVSVEPMQ